MQQLQGLIEAFPKQQILQAPEVAEIQGLIEFVAKGPQFLKASTITMINWRDMNHDTHEIPKFLDNYGIVGWDP